MTDFYTNPKKSFILYLTLFGGLETELQQLDFSIFSLKSFGISAINICINCADCF